MPVEGAGRSGPLPGVPLRLVSYNVRSLRDDRAALVEVVRALAPDVLCVQEAPRFALAPWLCRRFARECGLEVVSGGRPVHGPLLLAGRRVRVLQRREVRLPHQRGLHRRGIAAALLEVQALGAPGPEERRPGGAPGRLAAARVAVASTHLGLDAGERLRHAGLVLETLRSLPAPARVLAGDLNEQPGEPAWAVLAGELTDAWSVVPRGSSAGATFPARRPDRRIDAVLTVGAVAVEGVWVGASGPAWRPVDPDLLTRATDHLPVVADLVLDPAG